MNTELEILDTPRWPTHPALDLRHEVFVTCAGGVDIYRCVVDEDEEAALVAYYGPRFSDWVTTHGDLDRYVPKLTAFLKTLVATLQ